MDPWWTTQQAAWFGGIGGTCIGLLGAVLGTVGGFCAPRGKCKGLVFSLFVVALVVGPVLLTAGIVAVGGGQPYHVWYPLVISGGLMTFLFGLLLPVFRGVYRAADMRRLDAEALRRS